MKKNALAIFAHPDDAEIVCSGTLSLLSKTGWSVTIATMTPGDKGTMKLSRDEISRIRRAEASRSAALIGASYHCLEFEDIYIFFNRETINKTTALIRKIDPDIVFTSPLEDYMLDHIMTGRIVQTACFSAGIKNMEVQEKPVKQTPHLYYCDPIEGKNIFGNNVHPSMYVDVTDEMPLREKMLACHESQRSWLKEHNKMDEYILSMKRFARQRGIECGTKYAEGFTQHTGHGFPQSNILKTELDRWVSIRNL